MRYAQSEPNRSHCVDLAVVGSCGRTLIAVVGILAFFTGALWPHARPDSEIVGNLLDLFGSDPNGTVYRNARAREQGGE